MLGCGYTQLPGQRGAELPQWSKGGKRSLSMRNPRTPNVAGCSFEKRWETTRSNHRMKWRKRMQGPRPRQPAAHPQRATRTNTGATPAGWNRKSSHGFDLILGMFYLDWGGCFFFFVSFGALYRLVSVSIWCSVKAKMLWFAHSRWDASSRKKCGVYYKATIATTGRRCWST